LTTLWETPPIKSVSAASSPDSVSASDHVVAARTRRSVVAAAAGAAARRLALGDAVAGCGGCVIVAGSSGIVIGRMIFTGKKITGYYEDKEKILHALKIQENQKTLSLFHTVTMLSLLT